MKNLRNLFLAAVVALTPLLTFGAANDIKISQSNSGGTAWVDRIFQPSGGTAITTVATFRTGLGLGTGDSPTFTAVTLSGGTPITLAGGGTITASSGAISVVASGTNQNVTLTPSGTGLTKFVGASQNSWIGSDLSAATFGNLWLAAVTPSITNYVIQSNGSLISFNAPLSTGSVSFRRGDTLSMRLAASTGNLLLGGLTTDGTGVLQFPAATTNAGGIAWGTTTFLFQAGSGQVALGSSSGNDLSLRFDVSGGTSSAQIKSTQTASAADKNLIFQTNGTTTALTLDSSQNATLAGNLLRFATTKGVQGSNTNDDVAAGYIGEYASTLKAIGSPVSLSNNTAADIISVTLTAGDWDVTALANVTETTSTVTGRTAGITSTSATLPTDGSEGYNGVQSTLTSETNSIPLNRKRLSLSGTTTVYLDEKVTFSAGTAGGFGSINARRVR